MLGTRGARTRAWSAVAAVPLALTVLVGAGAPAARAEAPAAADFPDEAPERPDRYRDGDTGCVFDDPVREDGCLTGATQHLVGEVEDGFDVAPASCWDEHAWNPSSDHPKGRACDYTFGRIGEFPAEDDEEDGWLLADWLRDHAERLDVRYVIWDGRIWVRGDEEWRDYTGGGVYDPEDPTGGHYDHVHVSLAS